MIEWFAKNHVAANLLMLAIIVMGLLALKKDIALELLPDFELGTITISTTLPGGNPTSMEETITTRIEESIADLQGIDEINSRSSEGLSLVIVTIESDYDQQALLSDIKIRVDSLNTLPQDAERPVIELTKQAIPVIGLAVYGDVSYDTLFDSISDVREALLSVDGITQISDIQAPPREVHIEVSPTTLQQFNLSLEDIGTAIQRNSIDISAGNLRTRDGDILVRANGQSYSKKEFESIPVLNSGDSIIYLKDIANVIDGYQLQQIDVQYNGLPAITLDVFRIGKQNTIEVAEKVKQFMQSYQAQLPAGVFIGSYANTSTLVKDRLSTLITSATQGGILVLIVLSLFLRPSIAFWVGVGIPVSFLGGFALMPYLGLTLNMLSMFAFLLVLGIVVDDAIVTGENIYRHQRKGKSPADAALIGTKEVSVPVTFGVITTMVAFSPLLAVSGLLSDFAAQIPLVVIPVLAFSLIESKLILPSHMSTIKAQENKPTSTFSNLQQRFATGFEDNIIKFYRPLLHWCISNKTITISTALCIFIITVFSLANGWLKSSFVPDFQDNAIRITLTMPTNTGYETTKKHILRISDIAQQISNEYIDPKTEESYFKYFVSVAGLSLGNDGQPNFGTNQGIVILEFEQTDDGFPENFSIKTIAQQLRERIGDIPGAEKLSLESTFGNFGRPISISLYGENTPELTQVTEQIREFLKQYPGIFDIQDNFSSTKDEVKLEIKPLANSLRLTQSDIASQVRQAVFGFEAQRFQRGQDDIKVMVRYPKFDRSSINDVQNIIINTPNSRNGIALAQIADLAPSKSPISLVRVDQRRAITISADIDAQAYDVDIIRADIDAFLKELFIYQPDIEYTLDGQAKTQAETNQSFLLGFIFVIIAIYALLAIPFKSFGQPLVVMSIIPLAILGGIFGHYIMGLSFSMLSIMGILGLTGIVVNDSLVLVDYINKKRAEGMSILNAVLTAGETRFRPVILTSITTFVGLLPLMFNKSVQAQALIPMAVSLGFGILFATLITLIMVPVSYLTGWQLKHDLIDIKNDIKRFFQKRKKA